MSTDLSKVRLFSIKLTHIFIVFIFLLWIALYIFAEPLVYFSWAHLNINTKNDSAENLKIILNFCMASTVLCITFKDRYNAFNELSKKNSNKNLIKVINPNNDKQVGELKHESTQKTICNVNEQKTLLTDTDHEQKIEECDKNKKEDFTNESNKQFIPFVISLVPFTAATMDLGTKYTSPERSIFFLLIVLIALTIVDIKILFKFVQKTCLPLLVLLNFALYLILTAAVTWLYLKI